MRKRLIAVVAAVGLGALGVGAALAIPAMADDSTPSQSAAPSRPDAQQLQQDRQKRIREQLQSLVDDKTLTADQADKVAQKLATQQGGGPGADGHGPGFGRDLMGYGKPVLDAAAKALGLSDDDLISAVRGGSTLKQLADKQGKDLGTVESAITTAVKAQVAQAVKDGKLTQDQADKITQNLDQRVKDFAENGKGAFGFGGMGGMRGGPGRHFGGAPNGTPGSGGPGSSQAPQPAPSTSGTPTSF